MIRINFIASFRDYAQSQGAVGIYDEDERRLIMTEVAKRLAIMAIGPLGLFIYEMQTIPVLQQNLKDAETKYTELKKFNDSKQGLAQEIIKYEDEQARFNAQMDFINKIQADKVNEYKLFRHLKDATPATVWINKLTLTKNILVLNAESVDPQDINKFSERLSNTDFTSNPTVKNRITQANYMESGAETTTFEVEATLSTATPAEQPTPAAGGTP